MGTSAAGTQVNAPAGVQVSSKGSGMRKLQSRHRRASGCGCAQQHNSFVAVKSKRPPSPLPPSPTPLHTPKTTQTNHKTALENSKPSTCLATPGPHLAQRRRPDHGAVRDGQRRHGFDAVGHLWRPPLKAEPKSKREAVGEEAWSEAPPPNGLNTSDRGGAARVSVSLSPSSFAARHGGSPRDLYSTSTQVCVNPPHTPTPDGLHCCDVHCMLTPAAQRGLSS